MGSKKITIAITVVVAATVGSLSAGCSSTEDISFSVQQNSPHTPAFRHEVGAASTYRFIPKKLSDWSTCDDLGGAVLGTVTGVETSVEDGWLVESVLNVRIDATNNHERYGTESVEIIVGGGRTAASNITIEPKEGDEAAPMSEDDVVDEDWDGAPVPQVGERYVFFLSKDLYNGAYDVMSGPLGAYKMAGTPSIADENGSSTALDIASTQKFISPLHHATLGQINDMLASTPAGPLRNT